MQGKFDPNKYYAGQYINQWKPEHLHTLVITGPQQVDRGVDFRIGKVVQVRKQAGIYGTDMVFLRHIDGSLSTHENQWFYLIKEELLPYVEGLFKEMAIVDSVENSYSIRDEHHETGFIIPSKLPKGTVTPIQQVKKAVESILTGKDN